MNILSFNVNGIRAIAKKSFHDDMKSLNPDVICLQETKSTVEQAKEVASLLGDYHFFGNDSKARKGYSGTAILSKIKPISSSTDMGIVEFDQEGRVTCLEFEDYYIVTVYVPNSGSELNRLDYRKKWDASFLAYLKKLEKTKPVVVCGDFNVAHKDIDLARPKPNYNKSAGYMQEEIDGMDAYTSNGFTDAFRAKNSGAVKYSWWSYRGGARETNVGWRIDYFLVTESLMSRVEEAYILNDVYGSDHCPIGIRIK